jgi:hypothetical protein
MALNRCNALRRGVWQSCVAALLLLAATGRGQAFQVDTSATSGCHELITGQAMEQAGWPDGEQPPEPDGDARAALDDLPFAVPDDLRDAWGLALLIGARNNDVGSSDPFDFAQLTELHNDPDRQMQHCLRLKEHDREEGDVLALGTCRAYILEEIEAALGDGEEVDLERTESVETRLVFRGRLDLDLQTYGFHLGMAVHALQDSYTHTFRRADDERVRHVLNWIEGNIGDSYDIERDGHPHLAELDTCSGGPGARRRKSRALAASAELMAAIADGEGGRAGRLARAAAVLDAHMVREPGCVADNDWCGAPEADVAVPATCAVGGGGGGAGIALALVLVLLLVRRRGVLVLVLVVGTASASAQAGDPQTQPPPTQPPPTEPLPTPPPQTEPPQTQPPQTDDQKAEAKDVAEEAVNEEKLSHEEKVIDRLPDSVTQPFGVAVNGGASFDRGGAAASAGLRWNPWDSVGLGLDAEYNPWFSISSGSSAAGVASLYVPIIWKLKRFGTWELRSTFYVGGTMLLFDLVGIDKGHIGPFAGWNPLGLALPLGTHTKLVIKPGDIAIPVPQVTGIPFYYHQYRFTVGLEWYP